MVRETYEVAKKIQEITISANQLIFEEGEPGEAAYIVKSGSVAVFLKRDNKKKLLAKISPGGIIGEMALVDNGIRLASAMAITDTVVMVVTKSVFQDKLNSCDPFIRALLKIFIVQIRNQQGSPE
jgi:CRP/FNR family cyclic AMP-dependent transcriptional regulator